MSEPRDKPEVGFEFLPEYAKQIADAANRWSYLEYYINASIWALADTTPAIGACMTSQMYTMNAKISALLALLKLRKADTKIITLANKFAADHRDALEARNRLVHDIWLNDRLNPATMAKLRITADKALKFGIELAPLENLKADVAVIEKRRFQAGELREAIDLVLPTLPEMSRTELYPINETRQPQ